MSLRKTQWHIMITVAHELQQLTLDLLKFA